MEQKKSYIPIKVFISYLVLAALVVGVSVLLYSENIFFSETENKIASENNKVLKVSTLLSSVYETESLARATIQSNNPVDFEKYVSQTNALNVKIDSLKILVSSHYQAKLLDSVKLLLSRKTDNIKQLRDIKSKATDEVKVKTAINDLTRMELSLRKLSLEDFVKNPASLGEYQRSVLTKYVEYLNQNIPNDSTNTLTQKALDSILTASKSLLNDVKRETSKRNSLLDSEERKLLQNELSISAQLREILNVIEREIITNTTKNNEEKENTLKRIIRIVTIAATVGLVLTIFFSLLILNDFSKTQSYKKQLETANLRTQSLLKNREQLISTVSHDLKTPLSTIVGYSELLANADLTSKQLYYNKNIKGASEYISHLVQDLVDFTQIEAGKIVIESVPFSLSDIINDVGYSVQGVYPDKPIALQIHVDSEFDNQKIVGDPFRLRQILTNIIGNAYKFTADGFIKISAAITEKNRILINIEDSGIGIAPEKQLLIFEEFTQADDTIEKKYGGTGLGLTISKRMVEILGGSLSLESVYGKGSMFSLELPLKFDQNSVASISDFSADKIYTAIVVDDDGNLLKLTTEILTMNGYTIFAFSDANEALKALRDIDFDLVITDIQMPNMDGFEFLERLKNADATFKNQPIIAVTGKADFNSNTYKDAGFSAVVQKPYMPNTLLETLQSVLKNENITDKSLPELEKINKNEPYSLVSLRSFTVDDDGLKEILTSFIDNTKTSLSSLEKAVAEKDIPEIQMISHRMLPMFRQISAQEIAGLLEKLEVENDLTVTTDEMVSDLKEKIAVLFSHLAKELIV